MKDYLVSLSALRWISLCHEESWERFLRIFGKSVEDVFRVFGIEPRERFSRANLQCS